MLHFHSPIGGMADGGGALRPSFSGQKQSDCWVRGNPQRKASTLFHFPAPDTADENSFLPVSVIAVMAAELSSVPPRVPGLGGREGGPHSAKAPTLKLCIWGHIYCLQKTKKIRVQTRYKDNVLLFRDRAYTWEGFQVVKKQKSPKPQTFENLVLGTALPNCVTFGISLNHLKHMI